MILMSQEMNQGMRNLSELSEAGIPSRMYTNVTLWREKQSGSWILAQLFIAKLSTSYE